MELEKNELNDLIELRDFLIENKFPQSFIDLLEEYFKNNLLTIVMLNDVIKK